MVSLSSEDVEMVQAHLRCKVEPSGEGCTVKPDVFKGLRGLVALGVGDLLLYAGDYKKLFAERVEVFIHCDAKTITRAFRSIARDTDLVVRVGRRWLFRGGDLQLEDSELLRAIREATAGVQGGDARSSVETDWSTPTPRVAHAAPTVVATRDATKDSNLGSDDGTSIEHDPAPRNTTPSLHADEDRARHGAAVPHGAPLETGPTDEPEAASQAPEIRRRHRRALASSGNTSSPFPPARPPVSSRAGQKGKRRVDAGNRITDRRRAFTWSRCRWCPCCACCSDPTHT
jgi:hypothetical protein